MASALNKLSPDTQKKKRRHKQHGSPRCCGWKKKKKEKAPWNPPTTTTTAAAAIPPPSLPRQPAPSRRQAGRAWAQTESSPVISAGAHSGWGRRKGRRGRKKGSGYNGIKRGGSVEAAMLCCKGIHLLSSILFHLSLFFLPFFHFCVFVREPLGAIGGCLRGRLPFLLKTKPTA